MMIGEKEWGVVVFALIVLTPAIAATNGFMSFHIYIDNVSPTYSEYGGLSLIEDINQEFNCYALWSDDVSTHEYMFEWDKDGLVNDTAQPMINDWSNVTKSFNGNDEGKTINYRLHGYDKMGNINTTDWRQVVTASRPPEYSEVSQDNSSPVIGDLVEVSSYWVDNFEVDHVYLQTNESGSWHDNGSPVDIDLQEGWANFTIDTTGMNTSPYHWRLTGFDQVGNSNTTLIDYFIPQES